MKISTAAIFALPLVSAFSPMVPQSAKSTHLNMGVTIGVDGKPASSKEVDLLLTIAIIMDHEQRSVTVSKDQLISQMEEIEKIPDDQVIDISIPYDAAAKLAYEASDKSMAYDAFKTKYEADAVADVIAKNVDLSIPYDAAAKLAYEASDKSMAYSDFKSKFEADAVADVIAKKPIDVSIPYDAAAKLAYEASDKSMAYDEFKTKFEADAVADVIAKKGGSTASSASSDSDISIPYDAAAKLAYEASDKSMPYDAFKTKYEADAVAEVIAKRPIDVSIPYDAAAKLAFEASDKSMSYGDFKAKFEADAIADVIAKKK